MKPLRCTPQLKWLRRALFSQIGFGIDGVICSSSHPSSKLDTKRVFPIRRGSAVLRFQRSTQGICQSSFPSFTRTPMRALPEKIAAHCWPLARNGIGDAYPEVLVSDLHAIVPVVLSSAVPPPPIFRITRFSWVTGEPAKPQRGLPPPTSFIKS